MSKGEFIKTAILLVGVGLFWETDTGNFLYYTGLDLVIWYREGELWFINGEYGEDPFKLA